jgi:hypothetical protein
MDKGKLVVSAGGEGHPSITTWWIVEAIGAVVSLIFGYWMANEFGQTKGYSIFGHSVASTKNELYNIYLGIGAGIAALCLVMAQMTASRISKTTIGVYENVIEGISVVPKFPLSFMLYGSISSLQLAEFQLTYDKVFSVDVVNLNTVVINAPSVQHKIYAMNARDVRDAIMSRKDTVEGK